MSRQLKITETERMGNLQHLIIMRLADVGDQTLNELHVWWKKNVDPSGRKFYGARNRLIRRGLIKMLVVDDLILYSKR